MWVSPEFRRGPGARCDCRTEIPSGVAPEREGMRNGTKQSVYTGFNDIA